MIGKRSLFLLLVVCSWASLAFGSVFDIHPANGINPSGKHLPGNTQGRSDFVEGWNQDQPFGGSGTLSASCFGYPYSPGSTYTLTRVEFMAGLVEGPARIEIRADNGSGNPDGEVLGGGDFDQVAAIGWQGADFDFPVAVIEGMNYYIVYEVVLGGSPSTAVSGVGIHHLPSWDCQIWGNLFTDTPWMAKFFGDAPVESVPGTWDAVKALYQ